MPYPNKKPFYQGGYNKSIGTTELKWGSYLADVMFDTKYAYSVVWRERHSGYMVNTDTFGGFMHNFLELYLTTREFIEKSVGGTALVKRADKIFQDTNLQLNRALVKEKMDVIMKLYMDYNFAIYHTKALLEVIIEKAEYMEPQNGE